MRSAFGLSFDLPAGYLNTPSMGVPTLETAAVLRHAVDRWQVGGWGAGDFDEAVATSRASFAALVGCQPSTVAIGTSVSALVGIVASQVPDKSRVLVARDEFTSVSFPFAAQAGRGVVVDEADLDQLVGRAGGYDVVAVSAVQSLNGALADLDGLRRVAADAGCRVVVDVTQSAGWLPLDLSWADAVVCAGYKWLLSPRGCAWMAVRPDLAERLASPAANWWAAAEPWSSVYGLPMRLAGDARRFDTSPAWFCYLAAASALPPLAALDLGAVRDHCVGLANDLRARLGMAPAGSAIVSIPMPGAADRLAAAGVRASVRGGSARVGFHLYNIAEDVELAASALGGLEG